MFKRMTGLFLILTLLCCVPIHVHADEDERKALPIQSNDIEDWPEGPVTGAKAAIVMETDTGVILYAKNIHDRLYPASTTKLMTCLLAIENSALTDTVTFSYAAVDAVPPDGSRIGIDAGEAITMEEALYGIMVGSGNEVANAVAEHVAGSMDAFVDLMNARAEEMGLQDTHFTNPNGLHNTGHYTSAYDLCLIAQAFFESVTLSEIGGTATYRFRPTATQPDDFTLRNKHRLITGEVEVQGVIGGKTGFTDEAGECLVTCAQREGMKLISVVLYEDNPAQYTDSATLLEYGFNSFEKMSMAGKEEELFPGTPDFFLPERNLFGRPVATLSFDHASALILPAGRTYADAEMVVTAPEDSASVATFNYRWDDILIGEVRVIRSISEPAGALQERMANTTYVNLYRLLFYALLTAALFIFVCSLIGWGWDLGKRRRYRRRRRRRH